MLKVWWEGRIFSGQGWHNYPKVGEKKNQPPKRVVIMFYWWMNRIKKIIGYYDTNEKLGNCRLLQWSMDFV